MERSLILSRVDTHRDSRGNTKNKISRSELTIWHFFLLPLLCDNPDPLEIGSQVFACLVWSHSVLPTTTPTAYALGQTPIFFPSALKHTLSQTTKSSPCYIPWFTPSGYLDRSTEGIGKETCAVSLVLQSLHKDFCILLKSSVRGCHPQFSLQQTYREKLHFLFEVCFFCCFPQWESDQPLILSIYKITATNKFWICL